MGNEAKCCRICLDPCPEEDFSGGGVIRLGCRCSGSSSELMHRDCAIQWFGEVRKSTVCEVCNADCQGLPLEVKEHVSWIVSRPPEAVSRHAQQSSESLLSGFSSVPAFLGVYAIFCLLPSAIGCMLLTFFYIRVINDYPLGIVMSVVLSMVSIIHWLCFPKRKLLHICFVIVLFGSAVSGTILALIVAPLSWSSTAKAGVGSVLGVFFGVSTFYSTYLLGLMLIGGPPDTIPGRLSYRYYKCFVCCCCWHRFRPPTVGGTSSNGRSSFLNPLASVSSAPVQMVTPIPAATVSEGQAIAFVGHRHARESHLHQDMVWALGHGSG